MGQEEGEGTVRVRRPKQRVGELHHSQELSCEGKERKYSGMIGEVCVVRRDVW